MPTLGEIAARLSLSLRGDPARSVSGLASLNDAGPEHISFISNKRYLKEAEASNAGAIIATAEWAEALNADCLISTNPYLSFAQLTHLFDDRPQASGQISSSANVDPTAILGENVTVDCGAVVEPGATLGDNVWVGANAFVGRGVVLGAGTQLRPGVVIHHDCVLGEACLIQANAVIGGDGFGFAPNSGRWEKILQLGRVVIGDRVEIGATSTIDRGAIDDTVIADDVIIDNQVHVAHNVQIGKGTALAACVGIAGSTVIGAGCTLAGQVGIGDHIEIVDGVHIAGQGRATVNILEPGHYASGTSIQPFRTWSKNAVRFEKLNEMAQRITALEKQLSVLTAAEAPKEEDPS